MASPRGESDDAAASVVDDSASDGNESGMEGVAKLIEGKDVTGAGKRRHADDELAKVLQAELHGKDSDANMETASATQAQQARDAMATPDRSVGDRIASTDSTAATPSVPATPQNEKQVASRASTTAGAVNAGGLDLHLCVGVSPPPGGSPCASEMPHPSVFLDAPGEEGLAADAQDVIPPGSDVIIQGLMARPEYNSLAAKVIMLEQSDGTYVVELTGRLEMEMEEHQLVRVRRGNLLVSRKPPDREGARPAPLDQSFGSGAISQVVQLRTPGHTPRDVPSICGTPASSSKLGMMLRSSPGQITSTSVRSKDTSGFGRTVSIVSDSVGARLGFEASSRALRGMEWYSRLLIRCPCSMVAIYTVMVMLVVVIFWREFELDQDFSAFIKADGDSSRDREAYLQALSEKQELTPSRRRLHDDGLNLPAGAELGYMRDLVDENDTLSVNRLREGYPVDRDGRRLAASLYLKKSITVVYAAKDGLAFEEKVLRDMHNFESRLRSVFGEEICSPKLTHARRWMCSPGVSFDAFAWPTQSQGNLLDARVEADDLDTFTMTFDGASSKYIPLQAVLLYLSGQQQSSLDVGYYKRFFPKKFTPPSPYGDVYGDQPTAIRSMFWFWLEVGKAGMSDSQIKSGIQDTQELFREKIEKVVYPLLTETASDYENIDVYYTGDHVSGYEITYTLWNDCLWAMGSMIFVTVYMWIHIGIPTNGFWKFVFSFFFSLFCIVVVFTSIPVAYVLAPSSKTTIASFLSLFLMAGIGSDTIFVFIDFWEQSKDLSQSSNRLVFTTIHAGKSCLATSLTTAISFFANLASVLQPLREFGLFMGMCVMSAFLLVLLFIPPMLVIREKVLRLSKSAKIHDVTSVSAEGSLRSCCCPKKRQKMNPYSSVSMLLFKLVGRISKIQCSVVVLTVLSAITFIVGVALGAALEEGVPEIFPPHHNQVNGKKVIEGFENVLEPTSGLPSTGIGKSCVALSARDFTPVAEDACAMHWCDATAELPTSQDESQGVCYRSPTYAIGSGMRSEIGSAVQNQCMSLEVKARIADMPAWATNSWADTFRSISEEIAGTSVTSQSNPQGSRPLVLENWETGAVSICSFDSAQAVFASMPVDNRTQGFNGSSCEIDVFCFFGAHGCTLPGWESLGEFNFTHAEDTRRLAPQVALAPAETANGLLHPASRTLTAVSLVREPFDVAVVFGIRSPLSTPLVGKQEETWSFDPTFEPSNPWAQRAMLAVCANLPSDLKVISAAMDRTRKPRCWIADFQSYLASSGRRFPSREFDNDVVDWYFSDTTTKLLGQAQTWFVDRKMTACSLQFHVNVDKNIGANQAMEYKKKWDTYVDDLNDAASITANKAWHTASVWVRAEAEQAIILSTIDTIIIACVCAWIGMLLFTGDPLLAMQVTAVVIIIILGLAFFMVCMMGWEIGAIEVISLVVFVGYSVTYSLHIAHNYSEAHSSDPKFKATVEMLKRRNSGSWTGIENSGANTLESPSRANTGVAMAILAPESELTPSQYREVRTRMAMLQVGGAVLSSATSTVGSAMFLLFCTLNIFLKLGLVVIAVTSLSILFAVLALPAILLRFGPGEDPCYKRRLRQVIRRLQGYGGRDSEPVMPKLDSSQEPLVGGSVVEVLS